MKIYWKGRGRGVVDSVQEQTEQADALARIAGQELLVDPRSNPAVRADADRLRDERHRRILRADDRRNRRQIDVEERRAAHAELGLRALQKANDAASPAHSVIALHKGHIGFMGTFLAASITLSVGSAMGVEHLANEWDAPKGSGYIAEVGLTGLATSAILYRSHLTRHGGTFTRFQNVVLGVLMVVPLLASMLANIYGAGPVGVACSIGAAAFGLMSHIVADASAAALQVQAERVTGDEEDDLRRAAAGEDLFAASPVVHAEQVPALREEAPALAAPAGPAAAPDPDGSESGETRTQVPDRSGEEVPDRVREDGSQTRTRVQGSAAAGSETCGADRSETRGSGTCETQTHETHRSEASRPDRADRSGTEVPDQVHTNGPQDDQTQTRTRPKKRPKATAKALDRIDEAIAADRAYLDEHGRHIPAEKLAKAMRIGKPAALELVKQVRGGHLDIAQ